MRGERRGGRRTPRGEGDDFARGSEVGGAPRVVAGVAAEADGVASFEQLSGELRDLRVDACGRGERLEFPALQGMVGQAEALGQVRPQRGGDAAVVGPHVDVGERGGGVERGASVSVRRCNR